MRLIDADALIEDLDGSLFYSDAIPFVEDAPTAYDVDAVVEQIEEMFNVDPMYYGAEARWAVDKAIEIVRKGGVNE